MIDSPATVTAKSSPSASFTLLMAAYGAASLLHFAHNAIYLQEYPNLPTWLSSAQVWAAWFGVATVGLAAYLLMRLRYDVAGTATAAVWAAMGFDGLAHYSRAPFTAHTWAMNLTIWLEVVTAALLLVMLALRFRTRVRAPSRKA